MDGSGLSDLSNLVMGHRLYQMAFALTFRPDRKLLAELFDEIRDNLYHPSRNWTILVREHLNSSLGIDGVITGEKLSKQQSFLFHPLPECSCTTSKTSEFRDTIGDSVQELKVDENLLGSVEKCPDWMMNSVAMVRPLGSNTRDHVSVERESADDITESDELLVADDIPTNDANIRAAEPDDEMDPDD